MDNPSRSEKTRNAVIQAALAIIARDGPGRLTLDAIARESGISKGGLRLAAWHGPNNHPALKAGRPGEAMRDVWAIDVNKGGNAIPYHMEDPFIRKEFEETMAREGAVSRMEPKLYDGPPAAGEEPPDVM